MKRISFFLTAALLSMLTLSFTACDDDDDYWYDDIDIDEALDAYFYRYGDFGTDEQTTAEWFDYYYPHASDYAYNQFLQGIDDTIWNNQVTMASYLNGFWSGSLVMTYKDENNQTQSLDCTITWDFEVDADSKNAGRGQEVRTSTEGTTTTNFSWQVNNTGALELSFDPANEDDDPINMIVYYEDLYLSTTQLEGTAQGVNINETDEFKLSKSTYSKGVIGVEQESKVFGNYTGKSSEPVVKINKKVVKATGHR